ncbi:cytochrome c [Paracoccus sp. IB05]|uniref:c-type cytochrome n=1 Tax=Paracoccus sp. IB05 TaxID=2779367 RepID=UPI0018E81EE0|nr:cytochrome c [Paracoccus sp. IB05]MBJ2149799.1 cytochrome c [Paracoccus sp. IB05]
MKTVLRLFTALALVAVLFIAGLIWIPVSRTPASEALPADWAPEPGAGEYAMRAGDCMACHTAEGGADFAGGRAIHSPLGTIYTANITPDPETGIGGWTLDQFRAALVDGLSADGSHLYPAMPYENYRLLTEGDIRALHTYFMEEVQPVRIDVPEPDLPFPFNQRWGIRALNWLILTHDSGFNGIMGDKVLDRGQYLVEGPGHCAACHSPRTAYMGQDGITADQPAFLTGGYIDGQQAPALRGPGSVIRDWPTPELTAFLATGRNFAATANGEMGLVVEHSLQYLTDADIIAMARFLKALDGQPHDPPEMTVPRGPLARPAAQADARGEATARMLTESSPDMPLGARVFMDNCAQCHFVTGRGSPEIFPALQDNSLVLSDEITPLVSIILWGATVEGTAQRPMPLVMQGYEARLSDDDIAALTSFLREAWGNDAAPVSPEAVRDIRDDGPPEARQDDGALMD